MSGELNQKKTQGSFWQHIQGKLVLLLLVLLVPILIFQAYSYHEKYQTRLREELHSNLELARAVAKTFEAFVQDVFHQELAIGLAITSFPPPTPERINQILAENQSEQAAVVAFAWVSPEGVLVSAGRPDFVGTDISDRKYFQDIAAGRSMMVTDLVVSKSTGKPAFAIVRAIRNEQGQLLGMVLASIDPDRLDKTLGIVRSEGGGFALVDNSGVMVCRFPAIKVTWEERNWLQQFPQFEAALRGEEAAAVVYAPFEKKNRLVGFTPVPSIGWAVSAGRSEELAMAPVISTLLPNAILFIIITLVAFGLALALSRLISTPVKRLRNHALAIGLGETPDPADASGPVELRDLANSFNSMERELRLREKTLREQWEWLRVTLTSIGDAVIATDTKGRITFMNPVGASLTGWKIEEAQDQPVQQVFRIIDEEKREPAEDIVSRVLRDGSTIELANHTALIARDGREIPIEDSAAPIRDGSGAIVGVVLVFHDVTEKRRARDALMESERSYRSLFENMLNGFAYCRMLFQDDRPVDFEYVSVNEAFENLTGLRNVIG